MSRLIDIAGKKFGRWEILSLISSGRRTIWNCKCECGSIKAVDGERLKNGTSTSCGCFRKENAIKLYKKHPYCRIANRQRNRCTNKNNHKYKDYGGRGIEFRFKTNEEAVDYYLTLGPPPSPNHTLDRKDNDGHYEIGNIQWATKKEQALNQRKKRNTSSQYRGVRIDKDSNKWIAKITKEGVVLFLGRFQNELDAASAYLEKYFELHKKWPPEYSKTPLCYKTPLHYLGLIK